MEPTEKQLSDIKPIEDNKISLEDKIKEDAIILANAHKNMMWARRMTLLNDSDFPQLEKFNL